MERLKVRYESDYYGYESEVYAIDTTRDRFLILDDNGWFKWVPTEDCRLPGFKAAWEED